MNEQLSVLGGGAKVGELDRHFTDSQEKNERFRNVSRVWTDQCMTFDEGRQKLAEQQSVIHDYKCPLSDWQCDINDEDEVVLTYKPTSRPYRLTENAINNIASISRGSRWAMQDLTKAKEHPTSKDKRTGEPKVEYERDRTDAELLKRIVDHYLFHADRMDQDKIRLFRTWDTGTMRAILSDQYFIVNNEWYLELIESVIPGGLLSHWRGDADTIFGNVLIPDSIRQESDSAYGGMLSVGNSEIGLRRIMSLPSVFRAICMNGCIWDQEKGKGTNKVHRGAVNLDQLKSEIVTNLQKQIPLLTSGIDKLLLTKQLKVGAVSIGRVFAVVCKEHGITKKQVPYLLKAYNTEADILGSTDVRTAFGVGSAITRFGQELENDGWVKMDMVGGEFANLTEASWNGLLKRAEGLSDKQVENAIGDVSHLLS